MFDAINSNVTTVTNLTGAYTKDYNFYNPYIPLYGCSVQAVYTSVTQTAAVMASGSNVHHAVQATSTVTVLDYTKLANGDKITINGVDFVAGTDWSIGGSNNATATNIAALTPTGITGSPSAAVVTFTNTAYGTVGNANTISFTTATGGALSNTAWSGGIDATLTKTAHGLISGILGEMTTSSALPTGLSTSTDYWVIVIDANTFTLASSLANSQAGTRIQFTDNGTGNQTFTPEAISGIVVKLQMSNDGINFTDISGKTVTISATGSVLWDLGVVTYRVLRVSETPSIGAISLTLNFNAINLI